MPAAVRDDMGAIEEMSHFASQQTAKRSLLKGQWHFRRHVCIGAAGKDFRAAMWRARNKRAEETCVN
jgi:hypothetical protein